MGDRAAVFLALFGIAVAGCLGGVTAPGGTETAPEASDSPVGDTDTPITPPPETLTPRATPEKPVPLTEEAARTYVENRLSTRMYNGIIGPDTYEASASCSAVSSSEMASGYVVSLYCESHYTFYDGDAVTAGDGAVTAAYFVNDSVAERIETESLDGRSEAAIYAAENDSENLGGSAALRPVGFVIRSVDDANHTVGVRITYANASPPADVFDRSYRVSGYSGVEQPDVTARKGTYTVTVTVSNGNTATYRWRLSDARDDRLGIYVTPGGEVTIRPSPRYG